MPRTATSALGALAGMTTIVSSAVAPAHAEPRPPAEAAGQATAEQATRGGPDAPVDAAQLMATMSPIVGVRELDDREPVGGRTAADWRSELAARYASAGRFLAPSDVHLYDVRRQDGTSETVGSTDPFDSASFQPGMDRALRFVTPDVPATGARTSAAAAPRWASPPPTCMTSVSIQGIAGTAFVQGCYARFRLEDDGHKSFDWHGIRAFATANNAGRASVSVGRHECCPFPFDEWSDWSPRSDYSGGCRPDFQYGLSYVAEVSWTMTACEQQLIEKGSDPGVFASRWQGTEIAHGDREVAFAVAGRVNEGEAFRTAAVCTSVTTVTSFDPFHLGTAAICARA